MEILERVGEGLSRFLFDLLNVAMGMTLVDASWALAAGQEAAKGFHGIKIEAAATPVEVMVTASAVHLGRPRHNWAQVRVPQWDGRQDYDAYRDAMRRRISEEMLRKLAARDN